MPVRLKVAFCKRWLGHSYGRCDTAMPLAGYEGRQTCRLCGAVRPCPQELERE